MILEKNPSLEWTILKMLNWTTDFFRKKGIPSAQLDARLLLADTLKLTAVQLYTRFDQPLTADELTAFKARVSRRANREPVAYIIGHKEFWSLDFAVGPGVLIPRPDTERLVEEAIRLLGKLPKQTRERRVLPWSLGSGMPAQPGSPEEPVFQIDQEAGEGPDTASLDERNVAAGAAGASNRPIASAAGSSNRPDASAGGSSNRPDASAGGSSNRPIASAAGSVTEPPLGTDLQTTQVSRLSGQQPEGDLQGAARVEPPLVLDLCTGTAIIPICLAKETGARAIGVDLSPEALEYARRNVQKHELTGQVHVLPGDLAAPVPARFHGRFDLLTANPPYVTPGELETLEPEITRYEPRQALVGGTDGLEFYRRIAAVAPRMLKPGGWMLLEIGASQGQAVAQLLGTHGFEAIEVLKDLAGHDRVVKARRPVSSA